MKRAFLSPWFQTSSSLLAVALVFSVTTYGRDIEGTHSVPVSPGWNLLSLPASVGDGSSSAVFPSAISSAYTFSSLGGYEERDTLRPGVGFWLKFGSADTVLISGTDVFRDTIQCQAGWNIIGSISLPVNTGVVVTEPPGLIVSDFFEYVPGVGYLHVATLRPGGGYWVKMSEAGVIVVASPGGQPCPGTPTLEYAGKTYHTVQIGSRCWLRENLDVGTMVLGSQGQINNSIIEKYCYNDSVDNCGEFGGLYQWDEAMQYVTTQGSQGICPPAWHIPTLAEFQTLSNTVGGDGNALKAIGQGTGGGSGTNTSGFSALLAGHRFWTGNFSGLGDYVSLWSSTQDDAMNAHYLYLNYANAAIHLYDYPKLGGFIVRCLKD